VAWGYDSGYIAVVAATPAAVATAAAFVAQADRLYTGLNLTATPVGPLFPHSLYAPPFAAVRRVFNSSSEFRAATDAEVAATGQVSPPSQLAVMVWVTSRSLVAVAICAGEVPQLRGV
jgi:hypothetical protein